MASECHRIIFTESAKEMLRSIGKKFGTKTYCVLRDKIRELETDPDKRGVPLRAPLSGFHSLHYSRFRVIYRINEDRAEVCVVAAGHHSSGQRDDIYQVVERLVESGEIIIKPKGGPRT